MYLVLTFGLHPLSAHCLITGHGILWASSSVSAVHSSLDLTSWLRAPLSHLDLELEGLGTEAQLPWAQHLSNFATSLVLPAATSFLVLLILGPLQLHQFLCYFLCIWAPFLKWYQARQCFSNFILVPLSWFLPFNFHLYCY